MEQTLENKKKVTGWHVLAGFLAFFLTIFTANGIMTYYALGTWQGVQTEDAYVKGLNYNRQIEQAEQQYSSQWKLAFDQLPKLQNGDRVVVSLAHPTYDKDVVSVSSAFVRPVERGYDFDVALTHEGNQLYAAPVNFPLKGNWKAEVTVTFSDGAEMYLNDRMEIR